MRRHLFYLKYVVLHKWFVLIEGLKLGVPLWSLILHDWHKFLPDEWFPYARCFYKANGENQYDPTPEFWQAWNRHQKRSKHHWQYWILVTDSCELRAQPMGDRHRREMLADWSSFKHTKGGETKDWYLQQSMILNVETRKWVDEHLGMIYLWD